jgi:hypothetical protein
MPSQPSLRIAETAIAGPMLLPRGNDILDFDSMHHARRRDRLQDIHIRRAQQFGFTGPTRRK